MQDDDGVDVALADGRVLRTQYLVGCDGARSVVRKAAGIAFPGTDAAGSWIVAEVSMREEPQLGLRRDAKGVYAMGPLDDGRVRVVLRDEQVTAGDPTLDDLRAALIALYGSDFGVHDPTWLSRFSDAARQAATYRDGRVLLAGDAAHVHGPVGGQGLNLGLQDAVALGWRLAQVVAGTSPDDLLDTYSSERHPVGARVLQLTLAMTALQRADDHVQALVATLAEPLGCDEARTRLAARIVGLDIAYDLGDGHPLLGRRMPDLDLLTHGGPTRVAVLLRTARPLLLQLDGQPPPDVSRWAVDVVAATATGPWELPVLGAVAPPTAVLVRPDGHVAWVGEGSREGLTDALERWLGPPGPRSASGRQGSSDACRSTGVGAGVDHSPQVPTGGALCRYLARVMKNVPVPTSSSDTSHAATAPPTNARPPAPTVSTSASSRPAGRSPKRSTSAARSKLAAGGSPSSDQGTS